MKLGEISLLINGKIIISETAEKGIYPVLGGGGIT